jgi:hypothetical protein
VGQGIVQSTPNDPIQAKKKKKKKKTTTGLPHTNKTKEQKVG